MRRNDREIIDFKKMIEIVNTCDCCRLGLTDNSASYIVPLNFGYEVQGETLILYFHGADEGKKIDLIRKNQIASFEMDTKHELIQSEIPCSYSYLYQSVMGVGTIGLIKNPDEKIHALHQIMAHYSGKTAWIFPEKATDKVCIIKLEVTSWSCKEH